MNNENLHVVSTYGPEDAAWHYGLIPGKTCDVKVASEFPPGLLGERVYEITPYPGVKVSNPDDVIAQKKVDDAMGILTQTLQTNVASKMKMKSNLVDILRTHMEEFPKLSYETVAEKILWHLFTPPASSNTEENDGVPCFAAKS